MNSTTITILGVGLLAGNVYLQIKNWGKKKSIRKVDNDQILQEVEIVASKLGISKSDLLKQFPHLQKGISTVPPWSGHGIERWIDHTLLRQNATVKEIKKLCEEAVRYNFYSVCVNGSRVSLAVETLKALQTSETGNVKVCAVVGFPFGASTSEVKAFEAQQYVQLGASEVDMVINIGAVLDGDYKLVFNDIKAVVQAVGMKAVVKVILETSMLRDNQIIDCCLLAVFAGAVFVKTSTGFGGGGATVRDISIMKSVVGNAALCKASGGVKTFEDASALIQVGAARIGTSSGVAIIQGSDTATSIY